MIIGKSKKKKKGNREIITQQNINTNTNEESKIRHDN